MSRLQKAYDYYNRKYFGNSLPRIEVKWTDKLQGGTAGPNRAKQYAEFIWTVSENKEFDGVILMASWMRPHWSLWRLTLLHEMAHVRLRNNPQEIRSHACTHTKAWKKEMRRLAASGAMDLVW